jgi:hypothetical protein
MELDNLSGGDHGIGQVNRRKLKNGRIEWKQIIKLEDTIGGNRGIVGFDRKKSWDRTIESEVIIGNHGIGGFHRRKSWNRRI